jgi:dethiobiotin synthetase
VVVGTGTEIGKTWVSARLLEEWRACGLRVAARKPAQSSAPGEGPTDAEVLGAASGEDPEVVCPPERWYPVPVAPPMAARRLGNPQLRLRDLLSELCWPDEPVDVGLVETAGGLRSPQADDGDALDLAAALRPDTVLLVADAGLGTINAVRLATDALEGRKLPVVVVLNRYDATDVLHTENLRWLTTVDGLHALRGDASGIGELARRLAGPEITAR